MGGSFGQDGLVVEIDMHIGENGLFGRHAGDPVQCIAQMAMGWMGIAAQSIHDPAIEAL